MCNFKTKMFSTTSSSLKNWGRIILFLAEKNRERSNIEGNIFSKNKTKQISL